MQYVGARRRREFISRAGKVDRSGKADKIANVEGRAEGAAGVEYDGPRPLLGLTGRLAQGGHGTIVVGVFAYFGHILGVRDRAVLVHDEYRP